MKAASAASVHVLQVVHGLGVGGTERVVRELVRHFNDGHYRMSIACLDHLGPLGEELGAQGVRITVLDRRPGLDLRVAWRLRRLIRRERVDLVHAHQYTPYVYAAAACLLTPGVRVVFTEHGRHQPDRLRLKRAMANQILRLVTAAYTGVSQFSRQSLIAFERMPASRIAVIPNGLEERRAGDRHQARQRLGLGPRTPVVLTVGRLQPVKDVATLIRAFASVMIALPDAILLVAGDGDPAYRSELRRTAEALGLDGRVRFLGARDDVPDLLAACDVFALTSITEAMPLAVLEAMQAGRPVVATRVGGNVEVVDDGYTGLLVPVGDAAGTAAALVRLLTRPDEAGRLGAASQARVAAEFTADRTLTAYRRLYETCLAQ